MSNTEKYDYREFESKLSALSPHLSEQEVQDTIKKLFTFWENLIENIKLFK